MVFLIASYVFLPSLNANLTTRKVLIPFAFSVLLFSATDFFTIQQKRSQCVNPIQQATISDNRLCLIQSFLALGGAYALACWSALVIVHLHFLSVWRSKFIIVHIRSFHIAIWSISILATIIPIVTHHVASGNICFITPEASPMFYFPLSFIYVAFAVHVATVIYIANVTLKVWDEDSKESNIAQRALVNESQRTLIYAREMVRLQWRALAGAFLMVTVYTTAWTFFTFKYKLPDFKAQWFEGWLQCLETGTQTSCSSISAPYFPKFSLIIWLLLIKRCVGIFIFIILAAKKSTFRGWIEVLRGNSKSEVTASPVHGDAVVQITSV
ncbi:1506_t:CDS:2 [Paraglomus occultum]|uniref:1506_t:CDS:1 n=1 Tax=Paraglomus occultum TaxID=144539 RepID=A0A9N8Z9U9_9GLOM|nr:1506_t:CDS:2 [Paraglomus occultum]